ncbi:MAG TPA: hypothetical protein ENH41_00515 [Candidatus Omnitrophica bacterium]|nr:hypothetical protein [Candidatus Omnitrophota bacterium]
MKIFLDDKWVKESEARTPVYEAGFLYAQGLFETMRAYNRKVFRIDSHIDRLLQSLPIINLNLNYTRKTLKDIIIKTISLNSLGISSYVRLTVWQGEGYTHTSVIVKEYTSYPEEKYLCGARAILSKTMQDESSVLVTIKSSARLHFLLAEYEAKTKNADAAILLNSKGKVAEATRSNIFVIKNNAIFTSQAESGCLLGITRQTVIDIARRLKIKLYEKELDPREVFLADEVFITNSLIEIMPLTFLDGKKIGDGKMGKLTEIFLEKYRELALKG